MPEAPKRAAFRWDAKPLTNKEGDELLPKVKGMLQALFKAADAGISVTNKDKAKADIWTTIDDEDLDILAGHMVDIAKGSRIMATAVRKMSNSYRLLQMNLITLPKFIATFNHYQRHGGFTLFPALNKRG